MHQLVIETKISERKLQRDFKTALGLSPKEYCKIVRFKNLLNDVNNQKKVNWLDLVCKFGYYDQAHLINEFKSATGISPDVFLKHRNKSIFNIYNHLVIKPEFFDFVPELIASTEASYMQNIERRY